MDGVRFEIPPCPVADAWRLERALGVSAAVAQVLVRRGLADADAARRFLTAEEWHEPDLFHGIQSVVELILGHVRRGSRITVHGDYDVDGVCSTAVLVRGLRRLQANVDWYLPDRATDGYGLNARTVQRLAARGTDLLITADCAITAVEEVAQARVAGMEVVVTDHHSPRPDGLLPDAPIVHPAVCGYPCPHLCATAVAYKLALALHAAAGHAPCEVEADLDLVALATIADVVPLLGENRTLARRGLLALSSTTKPGLRALMAVARVDPGRLDERAVGFGLCPRINAAGRLYRADAGLELLLTEDPARAGQVARELDQANVERRHEETRMLFEAEAQVAELGERHAYVLSGEGWHPGVIGIVASRIAERHHRPAVLIAMDGPSGKGSGRSIPAFDLLAGLDSCAQHLLRHGGHRAAAGLEIARERLPAFAQAFADHAASMLTADDLVAVERVDAIVCGQEVDLEVAEDLRSLGPFGNGNPSVSLLVPGARLEDPRPMGEGRHLRFTVRSGSARARAVSFGCGARLPVPEETPADACFTLEINEYNGSVEPRLVLRAARDCAPQPIRCLDGAAAGGGDGRYLNAVWSQLDAPLPGDEPPPPPAVREVRDRRGLGIAAGLAQLAADPQPALVVCADDALRRRHLDGRAGGFDLCSYETLARRPELAQQYAHLAQLDPSACAHHEALVLCGPAGSLLHLLWGEPERSFALRVLERDHDLRGELGGLYRDLRGSGGAQGAALESLLKGSGSAGGRPAARAATLLRILADVELIALDPGAQSVLLSPERHTRLEDSAAFAAHARRLAEGRSRLGGQAALAA